MHGAVFHLQACNLLPRPARCKDGQMKVLVTVRVIRVLVTVRASAS